MSLSDSGGVLSVSLVFTSLLLRLLAVDTCDSLPTVICIGSHVAHVQGNPRVLEPQCFWNQFKANGGWRVDD